MVRTPERAPLFARGRVRGCPVGDAGESAQRGRGRCAGGAPAQPARAAYGAEAVCLGAHAPRPPPLPTRSLPPSPLRAGVTVKKTPATMGAKKLSAFKAKSKVTSVIVGRHDKEIKVAK